MGTTICTRTLCCAEPSPGCSASPKTRYLRRAQRPTPEHFGKLWVNGIGILDDMLVKEVIEEHPEMLPPGFREDCTTDATAAMPSSAAPIPNVTPAAAQCPKKMAAIPLPGFYENEFGIYEISEPLIGATTFSLEVYQQNEDGSTTGGYVYRLPDEWRGELRREGVLVGWIRMVVDGPGTLVTWFHAVGDEWGSAVRSWRTTEQISSLM